MEDTFWIWPIQFLRNANTTQAINDPKRLPKNQYSQQNLFHPNSFPSLHIEEVSTANLLKITPIKPGESFIVLDSCMVGNSIKLLKVKPQSLGRYSLSDV